MYDSIIFTDITDNISAAKPLGAYKCAQSLREAGYSCLVIDNFHAFDLDELLEIMDLAVGAHTRLVGFSNTFLADSSVAKNSDGSTPPYLPLENGRLFPQGQQVEDAFMFKLRQRSPQAQVLVGGARANPNEQNKHVDYVCLGYSEISLVNLMHHLCRGQALEKSWKNIWGCTIIDDRKAPDYDFVNSRMDWLPTDVVNQQVLPLEVARGCIFRCKFCSYPMNGKQQLDFVRSESQLMYELQKNYEEYGVFRYIIIDDTFNDNDYKLDLMLNGIKKLKFQPEFWAYTRLDLLARNIDRNFQKLYDIGLRGTQFGIETLHEPTGRIIGKGYSRDKQIAAVQHIRNKYGDRVSLHGTFIVGLPEETEDSCRQTFELLQTQEFPLHSWRWFGLGISKNDRYAWNSEIGLDFKRFGYHEISQDPTSSVVNWANKHTTFERASQLADEFNHISGTGDVMRLQNILGWSILTLGYEPEFITDSIYSQVNFNEIEIKKTQFMQDYKQQIRCMLIDRGQQLNADIQDWITRISSSRDELSGLAVCPYAHDSTYQIVETLEDLKLPTDQAHDVTIYKLPDHWSSQQVIDLAHQYNGMHADLIFLPDPKDRVTRINDVQTNNGRHNLILCQPRHKLNHARNRLTLSSYYDFWDKDYLEEILSI